MTHVAPQLHLAKVLKALPVRRDPHWGPPIARGRHVGYRKLDAERGTWIARMRGEDGNMRFEALGNASPAFQFDEAKAKAKVWFAGQAEGLTATSEYSVADACRAYVEARKREWEQAQAGAAPVPAQQTNWHDAELRFKRTVYDTPFGARSLSKLATRDIEKWRDGLGLSPASLNRTLTPFRAAVNLAIKNKKIPASRLMEMKNVKPVAYISDSTAVYLDLEQRRELLIRCVDSDFHDFVLANALTGARCGEIAKMKRRQFDARTGSATFIGKTSKQTGPRTVPLHKDAVALFARRAKGLGPEDLLFTRAGRMWVHYDWSAPFKWAVKAAKLPEDATLYCLRHAWITEALLEGMSTLEVAKLTGTSLAMIEKHYGHLVAGRAREQLNKIQLA